MWGQRPRPLGIKGRWHVDMLCGKCPTHRRVCTMGRLHDRGASRRHIPVSGAHHRSCTTKAPSLPHVGDRPLPAYGMGDTDSASEHHLLGEGRPTSLQQLRVHQQQRDVERQQQQQRCHRSAAGGRMMRGPTPLPPLLPPCLHGAPHVAILCAGAGKAWASSTCSRGVFRASALGRNHASFDSSPPG